MAGKIYAALGTLTALTLMASGVAFFSYERVDATLENLVERRIPVVELSLELSQAATASTALAARFSEISNAEDRKGLSAVIGEVRARQDDLL